MHRRDTVTPGDKGGGTRQEVLTSAVATTAGAPRRGWPSGWDSVPIASILLQELQ